MAACYAFDRVYYGVLEVRIAGERLEDGGCHGTFPRRFSSMNDQIPARCCIGLEKGKTVNHLIRKTHGLLAYMEKSCQCLYLRLSSGKGAAEGRSYYLVGELEERSHAVKTSSSSSSTTVLW